MRKQLWVRIAIILMIIVAVGSLALAWDHWKYWFPYWA